MFTHQDLFAKINHYYRIDETMMIELLSRESELTPDMKQKVQTRAHALVLEVRKRRLSVSGIDAFMLQYDLSSEEGIALMCLAEALLRIPDKSTIDKLIKDKLTSANWEQHLGKSHSMFVNAATWGLMLTGKVLETATVDSQKNILTQSLKKLVSIGGEPIVRAAMMQAFKILGKQFVMGRTIEEALVRAEEKEKIGYRFSYDMLGEAAFTAQDAQKYFADYTHAIESLAKRGPFSTPMGAPGISVKLSALHPRYEVANRDRVLAELLPRVKSLAMMAKKANINFTIDAEESVRLMLSLEIIEAIISDPDYSGWDGFGLAVQAYQKRASFVLDWLISAARTHQRKLMVRLVKGAYWDSEIKQAQVNGLSGYPVFTRKISTDISYIACAKKMLNATDVIFPQFATHNAYTLAVVQEYAICNNITDYEFQCLHGMGDALYDNIVTGELLGQAVPCRVYAPVGGHESLLAYLVRRLLENGANSSFVNRIVDQNLPVESLIQDPVDILAHCSEKPNPKIALPINLYGVMRSNSQGVDLSDRNIFEEILNKVKRISQAPQFSPAMPTVIKNNLDLQKKCEIVNIHSPIDNNIVLGQVFQATPEMIDLTLEQAQAAFVKHERDVVSIRTDALLKTAELLEASRDELIGLLILEAGKTLDDAIAEIREAVDFCRYYRLQALEKWANPLVLQGPTGEHNQLSLHGRGVVACISPWNFPLAIFLGQITAALAAGNTVIAKPAAQTPLIAMKVMELLFQAGFNDNQVQLLPGSGATVGQALVVDRRVQAIMFTGSTQTARVINHALAERQGPIIPFIAETGGQNAMIVDSSALTEQVVVDVINSAFRSAGQRCSALRVLYLQEEIFDKTANMLKGAMAECVLGNPLLMNTDIGPVIDTVSQKKLQAHYNHILKTEKLIAEMKPDVNCEKGTFFAPCAFELSSIDLLTEEHFGPFLHVIKYKSDELDNVINAINHTGFGLTLGIHSRIDDNIDYITQRARVGNIYVNRNMVGAVVGVQPFGGEGLSGTGPKAGGPHYMLRLCVERTLSVNTTAAGGNASLMAMD